MMRWICLAYSACVVLGLGACTQGTSQSGNALPAARSANSNAAVSRSSSSAPISHVIIVIQENRSFDNLFATFPGAEGTTTGKLHNGTTIQLKARKLESKMVLNNSWPAFVTDYDKGKMDGFDLVWVDEHQCTLRLSVR